MKGLECLIESSVSLSTMFCSNVEVILLHVVGGTSTLTESILILTAEGRTQYDDDDRSFSSSNEFVGAVNNSVSVCTLRQGVVDRLVVHGANADVVSNDAGLLLICVASLNS